MPRFRGPVSRRQPKRSFTREVIVPGLVAFLLLGMPWLALRSGFIEWGVGKILEPIGRQAGVYPPKS